MANIQTRCWFKAGNTEDHNSTTSLLEAEGKGKGKERKHRAEHHTRVHLVNSVEVEEPQMFLQTTSSDVSVDNIECAQVGT